MIIEDEKSLVDVLTYNFENEGFEVLSATDGMDGLNQARAHHPDIIILDVMLPVMEGLEVCRQLRSDSRTSDIPVLMLTAKSEEVDEIVGFRMGADDYVTKPFKLKPLIQRIKALLRRSKSGEPSKELVSKHGIEVDRLNHRALAGGDVLDLTPTEFDLLWTLVRKPGRPFKRADLMEACRGEDALSLERTIDVHIRSLRQKLGTYSDLVETVRGVGYRFRETEPA
ncbi:Phosphate regulon transcriptional regulatory protein PhoB [Symmachiella macrocystis]|uniref:Phosphate regulon transcriptional regulatory protein PhoB n=1 Tax=Symmachiella macrocystis TaxID=2527985 RepID=A0A5C6BTI6_9PLAN|nr:Phosphate regulon transcriptional regulatory protein PhoB [Symmachiella macrocystis]